MTSRTNLDILLLISLYLLPQLSFISNLYDEVVFMYMLVAIIARMVLKNRDVLFPILIVVYLMYSLFLIVYNSIPITHIMQIFITSKFLIIFLYFYTNSDAYKELLFRKLMKLIIFIFILSLSISILQFILPSYFHGYSPDGRGWMGINASGIFFSRISYSSFLVMSIILIMSIRVNHERLFQNIIKYRYTFLVITLTLLVLTFARKEMIIGFVLLIYLFKDRIRRNSKFLFYILLFVLLILFTMLFYILFLDINNSTFTEKQIRFLMLIHSWDIFTYYFPFGSGPGTYGSIMSIDYTVVYEKFNVAKFIYLGYGDDVRGPIFDLYLFGLLAEYGLGLILILYMLKKIAFSDTIESIDYYMNSSKIKLALIVQLFIVSIFVPIFGNWIGFLIFTILGILSTKRKRYHKVTK